MSNSIVECRPAANGSWHLFIDGQFIKTFASFGRACAAAEKLAVQS